MMAGLAPKTVPGPRPPQASSLIHTGMSRRQVLRVLVEVLTFGEAPQTRPTPKSYCAGLVHADLPEAHRPSLILDEMNCESAIRQMVYSALALYTESDLLSDAETTVLYEALGYLDYYDAIEEDELGDVDRDEWEIGVAECIDRCYELRDESAKFATAANARGDARFS